MGKRGKQQKYAVFNVRQLKNMIASTSGKEYSTVILEFESAGKKWPGQLTPKNRWWRKK
jgi:hypothetical protein